MTKETSQSDYGTLKLRKLILDMELKPGEKITERSLEERVAISRTSIRTALFKLENEGLVSRKERGWIVSPIDLKEISQLCNYRMILETASIRQTTYAVIKQKLPIAEKILKAISKETYHQDAYKAGCEFHSWIASLSGNDFVIQSVENATLRLRRARFLAGEQDYEGWVGQSAIISALKDNNLPHAITLTEDHLSRKSETLLKTLKEKKQALSKEGALLLSIED